MAITFPYEFVSKISLGSIYRPIALVEFQSLNRKIFTKIWMVVDTGADFSILPKYVAEDLQISFSKDCIADETSGVGGKQKIYFCKSKLTAKIGHYERKIPLGFFDNDSVPPLLGRLGFLETFDTKFLKIKRVEFS